MGVMLMATATANIPTTSTRPKMAHLRLVMLRHSSSKSMPPSSPSVAWLAWLFCSAKGFHRPPLAPVAALMGEGVIRKNFLQR